MGVPFEKGGGSVEQQPTFGELVLGLEGLAILRSWMLDPVTVKMRAGKIVEIAKHLNESPWSNPVVEVQRSVSAGYGEWATKYDDPSNPVIVAEEPVVRRILAQYPSGTALDAACGTGRHAEYLASQGHSVTGLDASPAMLEVAKSKIPSARFEVADLSSIPLPNDAVDLAVCSLALTHCQELGPPTKELARVLRPGGTLVISDVHPFLVILSGHASYPLSNAETGFIRNYVHHASAYIAAFREAGLEIVQCIEPLYGNQEIAAMDFAEQINEVQMNDLMEVSVKGLPIVIIWELVKSS